MMALRLFVGATVLTACLAADVPLPQATAAFTMPFGSAPVTKDTAPALVAAMDEVAGSSQPGKASMGNAVEAAKADMWKLITIKDYQWVVAIFTLAFGLVAIFDGKKFFQLLALIVVVGVNFCFVLSQLRATWVGNIAKYVKYVASLEVGLFIGYALKKGWEGAQLLLGLAVGIFLYHTFQGIALAIPHVQVAAEHSVWRLVVGTLMVLLGCWAVDDKLGAGRFLGVVCPLFGSTMVAAALSYLLMLSCTLPGGLASTTFHKTVTMSDIPSIFEYWYMIAYPMHSQAVGIFNFADKHLVIGKNSYPIDRILGEVLCFVFFYFGARFQLRADSQERKKVEALPA